MKKARIDLKSNEWTRYQKHMSKDRGSVETVEYIERLQLQIDALEKMIRDVAGIVSSDDSK